MACRREIPSFFFNIQSRLRDVTEDSDKALNKLIARAPTKYKLTLFRAFLNLSKEECENMSIGEYIDNCIILDNVLHILHAPFLTHD
jgi:hypothetical protein